MQEVSRKALPGDFLNSFSALIWREVVMYCMLLMSVYFFVFCFCFNTVGLCVCAAGVFEETAGLLV